MFSYTNFFDVSNFEHESIFINTEFVWDGLKSLREYINAQLKDKSMDQTRLTGLHDNHGATLISERANLMSGALISGSVYIGEGTIIEPGAFIQGPTIIGSNCEVRHAAYIRGGVLVGDNCVIGHCSEVKNSILLDRSHAPHFCYVGDSILGNDVNLGAGTKLANLPLNSVKDPISGARNTIKIRIDENVFDTGLSKLGAILGDRTMTGCNSVTNPGCVLQRDCQIYPNSTGRKGLHLHQTVLK